jgi:hypothetical protein
VDATTSATFYSRFGNIDVTGANVFGTLILTGDDTTVEEAGNMTLGRVRVRGALDVTTTAGGNLTQLVNQRVVAARLQGDIDGSITSRISRTTSRRSATRSYGCTRRPAWKSGARVPRAAVLDGVISTTSGDIILVANPAGKFGLLHDRGEHRPAAGNRWVIYSYYDKVPSLGSDLDAALNPDALLVSTHPYGGVLAAGNVLVYVTQTGRRRCKTPDADSEWKRGSPRSALLAILCGLGSLGFGSVGIAARATAGR